MEHSARKRLLSAAFLTVIITGIGVILFFALSGLQKSLVHEQTQTKQEVSKSPEETTEKTLKSAANPGTAKNPIVVIETDLGDIKLELGYEKAPITVDNFLQYVNSGFYNGTIFHRVIAGFVIQGGGLTEELERKEEFPAIKNEAKNGLTNQRGTIAMARTPFVHSATSQFFINVVDNPHLDYRDDTASGYGYCVFGKVIDGMNVVDRIANVPTHNIEYYSDIPVEPIRINNARQIK